tara:strand:+ start:302 stop:763 length:462 start_codon:yes stop_codon:yes gene_type:complete
LKYKIVATGGTFDVIHVGHKALLTKSFEVSKHVIIGLSNDEFAYSRGKSVRNKFAERKDKLVDFLKENFPEKEYTIVELSDYFGPVIYEKEIEGIVVSEETKNRVKEVNQIRLEKKLPELKIEIVELLKDSKGSLISTTRIIKGEIDEEGQVI